jgi:hypothetical protein
MANWWDQIGTGLGDALVGINQPFGMAPPQGYDRQAAIKAGALQLGTNMLANPYATPMEAIGKGYQNAQAQGGDRALKAMQAQQMLFDMDEKKRKKAEEDERRLLFERTIQGLPPDQQALAQANPEAFMQHQFQQTFAQPEKPTDDLREYDAARKQGYTGSFMDYMSEIKRAGAPQTTVDLKGENAYAVDRGKAFAKTASDIDDGERSAFKTINSLNQMETLVKDPSFYSGFGAAQLNSLKKAAVALGADPSTITSTEQFNTLSKQTALDTMGGSLGTGFSNADRDFVEGQVPNIANTPAGNLSIIGINRKMQKRKIEIARLARAYEKKNGKIDASFLDELSQWAEANPLFDGSDISTSGANKENPSSGIARRKYNPNTGKIE